MEQNFERKRILGIRYRVKHIKFKRFEWFYFIINYILNILIIDISLLILGLYGLRFGSEFWNIFMGIIFGCIFYISFANIMFFIYYKNVNVNNKYTFKGIGSVVLNISILLIVIILYNLKVI